MGRYLILFIPHFWFHEGGHFLAALLCGHRLHFYYSEGHLGPLTIPRYCWRMPWGLTRKQEDMILRAGFRCEFAGALLFAWCLPLAGLYLFGACLHFALYRHYGGNPRELEVMG